MRVVLALLLLSTLALTEEPLKTCQQVNPANGLTYDLLPMARGAFQVDYHLSFIDVPTTTMDTFFVNVCADTKEACQNTPVCEQKVPLSYPFSSTVASWGSLDQVTWLPYQPDTTKNGISLRYDSSVPCTSTVVEGTVGSVVNVLCDTTVLQGAIDTITTSSDQCTTTINMRSRFGCGFPAGQPLTCSSQIPPEPVACTNSGQGNFECSTGSFVLQVTGNQNVPKYSFAGTSTYDPVRYEDSMETPEESGSEDEDVHDESDSGLYELMFHKLLETDASGQKTAQVSLPSISWAFMLPEVIVHDDAECSQETSFNITNTDGPYWAKLVLVNHLTMDNATSAIKFDVVIEDYTWQDAASTHLVVEVSLSGPTATTDSVNTTAVTVGDAYLVVNPTAFAYADSSDPLANQTVAVSVTSTGDSQSIIYDRFVGSLVHDPTLGLTSAWKVAPPAPCGQGLCEFSGFSLSVTGTDGPDLTMTRNTPWTAHLATMSELVGGETSSAVALADLSWTVSPAVSAVLDDGTVQVAMSLTSEASARWSSMELQMLISMKEGVSHLDLVLLIKDYEWASDDNSAALQLLIDVQGAGAISYTYDAVVVGDNYLVAQPIATAKSATMQQLCTMSLAYDSGALATFSHFEGSLSAGLRMGISSSTDPFTPKSQMVEVDGLADDSGSGASWGVWVLLSFGVVAGVVALVAIVGFLVVKRKGAYENLD